MTASADHTFRIWDNKSQEQLISIKGHSFYVMNAQFHPEKNFMISRSCDNIIKLWNFDKLAEKILGNSREKITNADVQLVKSVKCKYCVYCASFHPHSDHIVSCDYGKNISIWSHLEADLSPKKTWKNEDVIKLIEFHPNTGQLVSCSDYCICKVWGDEGDCHGTYIAKEQYLKALHCHKTLPLVAIGGQKSLVILALDQPYA